jgi:hypothetical protein
MGFSDELAMPAAGDLGGRWEQLWLGFGGNNSYPDGHQRRVVLRGPTKVRGRIVAESDLPEWKKGRAVLEIE